MTTLISRSLPSRNPSRGRVLVAGEPLIFHCNHYNYWLQNTLLLTNGLGMEGVMLDAAAEVAHAYVGRAATELGLSTVEERKRLASDLYAQQGFGTVDFASLSADGGSVVNPTSHYAYAFSVASDAQVSTRPQNYFDAGFAAGAASAIFELAPGSFEVRIDACRSMGAERGITVLERRPAATDVQGSPGAGHTGTNDIPGPNGDTNVDEAQVLQALAGLDLAGNEEGLIPRFGVMLTEHFANYYNRISFEFVHRMESTGLLELGETLLVDAGYQCAFNTFGGVMVSAEWDAVVKPQCQSRFDWVHGMVACVNALGWGVWRVQELSDERLVVRIYDDYESCGYRAMYGMADRPVSYLAQGGVVGIMNLIFVGAIDQKPVLDSAYFEHTFNADGCFKAKQEKCLASGDPFTEIVAWR